jgi:hypothetical protein
MSDAALKIANLLYTYAERMDAGDLEGAAGMFAQARVKTGDSVVDGSGLLALWKVNVKLFPCGTPRTKHVITNPIIEIDPSGTRATCRSYYTVLQATPNLQPQVIAAGRYHDVFVLADGEWRFDERDYSLLDLVGNVSEHLLLPLPDSRGR